MQNHNCYSFAERICGIDQCLVFADSMYAPIPASDGSNFEFTAILSEVCRRY